MRFSWLPVFLLGFLLQAPTLAAQAPASDVMLLALSDSLARADSTTDRQPFDQAIQRIERQLDRHPRSPRMWHALGRVRASMGQRGFPTRSTPYHAAGISYRNGAMEAWLRALKADSAYLPAAEDLARQVVLLGARKLNQDFAGPLTVGGRQPGATPTIFLALSRLAWSDGQYLAALRTARSYGDMGDRAVAAIESARAHAAMQQLDSAALAYESGLAGLTATGKRAYREDLGWAAGPEELEAFDALPSDSAGGWISRFWRQRDALEMRAPGERLREHLRRWVYAHQKFPIFRPDDAPIHGEGQRDNDQWNVMQGTDPFLAIVLSSTALNTPGWKLYERTQWEVDDRGVIYVRHGEPTKKVSDPSGPPNESWLYQRASDRPIFHFLGSHALGTTAATTLVASLPMSPEMLTSRGVLDPRYGALGEYIGGRRDMLKSWSTTPDARKNPEFFAAIKEIQQGRHPRSGRVLGEIAAAGARGGSAPLFSPGLAEKSAAENERGRRTVITGVSSDGHPREFARQLDAVVQLHGVGIGPGETRRVLAVFAIEGKGLVPRPRPDGRAGFYYPIALRLVAMDRHRGIVRQVDTLRNFVTADSLGPGQHLTGYVEFPVPAGSYQVRALITSGDNDAGAAGARDDIDLTGHRAELTLSDLILGREGSTLTWRFAAQPFPLNPLNAFPRGTDAELLYELGGLTEGKEYRVRMSVRRPGDAPTRKPLVETLFTVRPASSYQLVRRVLGLRELKPGGYNLTVTIDEAGSDRSVSRSRVLNILDQ
jgi:hypothetical protein